MNTITSKRFVSTRWVRTFALAGVCVALTGCESLAITALGIGASAGVTHTTNGISYRTFTAPTTQVRAASLAAMSKMGIKLDGIDKQDTGEVIKANYANRSVEIELEVMSSSSTQMRAKVKRSLFVYDAATAKEIVEQTERAMAAATPPADKRGKHAAVAPQVAHAAG